MAPCVYIAMANCCQIIHGSKQQQWIELLPLLVKMELLGLLNMKKGVGEEQASAYITYIEKWDVKGILFDTAASDTGFHQGACIHIEKYVETRN